MPKRIVLCSDGTGNSDIKNRGTNVFKLFEAVDKHWYPTSSGQVRQIAFYDDGVGTQGLKYFRLFGAAFGWGLSRNVKDLYTELARVYAPGDAVFLFGFSRGAFTVRTLAGFIGTCGILDAADSDQDQIEERVGILYQKYRERYWNRLKQPWYWKIWKAAVFKWMDWLAGSGADAAKVPVHPDLPDGRKADIAFLGVWDTVDAVGLPVDWAATLLNNWIYPYKFPSRTLNHSVAKACHAISIDDERHTFHPVLWEADKTGDRIEQIWFPGVHANVGGGYPKQGLSLIALDWIAGHAEKAGLRFIPSEREYFRQGRNARCRLYDSRAGFGVYYRYLPRDIEALCKCHNVAPLVHMSVLERIASGTAGYAPGNLGDSAAFVDWDPATMELIPEPALVAAARPEPGRRKSLRDQVRFYRNIRRHAHTAATAATAACVGLTLLFQPKGTLPSVDNLTWVKVIAHHWQLFLGPLLALLGAYAAGRWARRKMHHHYCRYWFPYKRQLSRFLN